MSARLPGDTSQPQNPDRDTIVNLGAIAAFAFVSSITPGPNNLMLWSSGMNFGFRGTIGHLAGVFLGFLSLVMVTAIGIGSLFQRWPWLNTALRVIGSVYLLYLAWRIAQAGRATEQETKRPISFGEAVAFQYVNPKAWVMGITAAGSFLPDNSSVLLNALILTAVFGVVNLPCVTTWVMAGTGIGKLLTDDRSRRIVNGVLAALLVGTVYLINT